MTDRNAKPFTLFIFGLIFLIMVVTQIFVKTKYEDLLRNEIDDFTVMFTEFLNIFDEKICMNLETYSGFETAPDAVYQKMLDSTSASLEGVDAAYIFFDSGKTIWSSKNSAIELDDIDIEKITNETYDCTDIYRSYDDKYVYYSKSLYLGNERKGVICLQAPYEHILDLLSNVYDKFSWLNVIIKNKYGKVIYQTSSRLERETSSTVDVLFENANKGINEGDDNIIYQTKSAKSTINKDVIGNYKKDFINGDVEREILRRNKQISTTRVGENLQISITASSTLKDIDPYYYTRFIIMLFLLLIILTLHLIAGFFVPDKNMLQEFIICIVLFGVIYFTHFTLELGFLNNIYENELEYYGKLTTKINDFEYNWFVSYGQTIGEFLTIQEMYTNAPGYNETLLNAFVKQIVSNNNDVVGLGVVDNGSFVYKYPYDYDTNQFNSKIKETGTLKTQDVFYNKSSDSIVVLSNMHSKLNPNSYLLIELKPENVAVLSRNDKFEIFGFRDAYGDSKLLNLQTDEAIETFVEKETFGDKIEFKKGMKSIDGILYGYIMLPNEVGNINVYRYELENLYSELVLIFVLVMIMIILIGFFSKKIFTGYMDRRQSKQEDTVYDKLIEKIDQDIADSGDDVIE